MSNEAGEKKGKRTRSASRIFGVGVVKKTTETMETLVVLTDECGTESEAMKSLTDAVAKPGQEAYESYGLISVRKMMKKKAPVVELETVT